MRASVKDKSIYFGGKFHHRSNVRRDSEAYDVCAKQSNFY